MLPTSPRIELAVESSGQVMILHPVTWSDVTPQFKDYIQALTDTIISQR